MHGLAFLNHEPRGWVWLISINIVLLEELKY